MPRVDLPSLSNEKPLYGFKQESKEIDSELNIYTNCGLKNGFMGWGSEQETSQDATAPVLAMTDGGPGQWDGEKKQI